MFSADISVTKSVCGPKLYSNYNLCVNDNLQKGCKFTNDKGTLHWSHTESLMSERNKIRSDQNRVKLGISLYPFNFLRTLPLM